MSLSRTLSFLSYGRASSVPDFVYRGVLHVGSTRLGSTNGDNIRDLPENVSSLRWTSKIDPDSQAATLCTISELLTIWTPEQDGATAAPPEPWIREWEMVEEMDGRPAIKCYAKLDDIDFEVQLKAYGTTYETRFLYRYGIRKGTAFAYDEASGTFKTTTYRPRDHKTVARAAHGAYLLLQENLEEAEATRSAQPTKDDGRESGKAIHRDPLVTFDMLEQNWAFVWGWVQPRWQHLQAAMERDELSEFSANPIH